MPLVFREAHASADKKRINEEWFILENAGATSTWFIANRSTVPSACSSGSRWNR